MVEIILRRLGNCLIDAANASQMRGAQLDRLASEAGISLGVPEESGTVTDEAREAVLARRESNSKSDWLRPGGPRDQECVRWGISPQQVAGILARATHRANGQAASFPGGDPLDEPEGYTTDPTSWPAREAKNGADFPPIGSKEYEHEPTDHEIVITVFNLDPDNWSSNKVEIAKRRRLNTQQLAWILSRARRDGKLTDVSSEVADNVQEDATRM